MRFYYPLSFIAAVFFEGCGKDVYLNSDKPGFMDAADGQRELDMNQGDDAQQVKEDDTGKDVTDQSDYENSNDNCQSHCKNTVTCRDDPYSHSSYCKSWQHKPVCFGLYWNSDGKSMCFQPNDSSCDQSKPVKCGDSPETTTTEAPETTTTSPDTTTSEADTTVAPDTTTSESDTTVGPDTTTPDVDTTVSPETTTFEPNTTVAPDTTTSEADTTVVPDTTTPDVDTTVSPETTTVEPDTTVGPETSTSDVSTTVGPVTTTITPAMMAAELDSDIGSALLGARGNGAHMLKGEYCGEFGSLFKLCIKFNPKSNTNGRIGRAALQFSGNLKATVNKVGYKLDEEDNVVIDKDCKDFDKFLESLSGQIRMTRKDLNISYDSTTNRISGLAFKSVKMLGVPKAMISTAMVVSGKNVNGEHIMKGEYCGGFGDLFRLCIKFNPKKNSKGRVGRFSMKFSGTNINAVVNKIGYNLTKDGVVGIDVSCTAFDDFLAGLKDQIKMTRNDLEISYCSTTNRIFGLAFKSLKMTGDHVA